MINPLEIMKNLENYKAQAEQLKQAAESIKCTGYAMGNQIEVVANGKMEIESLRIDPSLCKEGNVAMLEVLVASAVNNAFENVRNRMAQETARLSSQLGLNI